MCLFRGFSADARPKIRKTGRTGKGTTLGPPLWESTPLKPAVRRAIIDCRNCRKSGGGTMRTKTAVSQNEIFQNLPVPTALRMMVVPAVTSQLIVLIYNMADTFFVGQTNNPYMVAGTSLILPVFNITLCLAGLAGIGGRLSDLPPAGAGPGGRGQAGQRLFPLSRDFHCRTFFHWNCPMDGSPAGAAGSR